MKFPLWQYLNQLLLDTTKPAIISPSEYWRIYSMKHLKNCLNNNFIEYCWNYDYYQFTKQHRYFIARHYLEEDNRVYIEFLNYCWQLDYYRFRPL